MKVKELKDLLNGLFDDADSDNACVDVKSTISVRAVDIEWDTDGQDIEELYLLPDMDIPLEVAIDNGEIDEDAISNYISEKSGFCHYGFNIAVAVTKII